MFLDQILEYSQGNNDLNVLLNTVKIWNFYTRAKRLPHITIAKNSCTTFFFHAQNNFIFCKKEIFFMVMLGISVEEFS